MMTTHSSLSRLRKPLFFFSALALIGATLSAPAMAQDAENAAQHNTTPSLSVVESAPPQTEKQSLYSKPLRVEDIDSYELTGEKYFVPTQTPVTEKIADLYTNLGGVADRVKVLSSSLNALQRKNIEYAAAYYAAIATINAQLQSGTTPGNPRLINRLEIADSTLGDISVTISDLSQLNTDAAHLNSETEFLLNETRAAFRLSGAIEEDHVKLAQLEDEINKTAVEISRVLNYVNDDIARTSAYIGAERQNLQILSMAVSEGSLYGNMTAETAQAAGVAPADVPAQLTGPRPLVKIRFDNADVDFEEPVYMAINEALNRYPEARFDVIAVHPAAGNAAEVAIASTRARRDAERVLESIKEMGLPEDRIELSQNQSADAKTSEVHIFIR